MAARPARWSAGPSWWWSTTWSCSWSVTQPLRWWKRWCWMASAQPWSVGQWSVGQWVPSDLWWTKVVVPAPTRSWAPARRPRLRMDHRRPQRAGQRSPTGSTRPDPLRPEHVLEPSPLVVVDEPTAHRHRVIDHVAQGLPEFKDLLVVRRDGRSDLQRAFEPRHGLGISRRPRGPRRGGRWPSSRRGLPSTGCGGQEPRSRSASTGSRGSGSP